MVEFRRFKVATEAVEDGIRLGIKGDVEKEIAHMARFSGTLTYPGANRRFRSYALNIQHGTVVAVLPFDSDINKEALAEQKARKRRRKESSPENGEA